MKAHNILFLLGCFLAACGPGQFETEHADAISLAEKSAKLHSVLSEEHSTYKDILGTIKAFYPQLNKSKTIDAFEFKASYQPHLLLAINNAVTSDERSKRTELHKTLEGYSDLHYIQFSIENKEFHSELLRFDLSSAQEYSDRIMYYSFYCNKNAYIIENERDTIACAFVHFERTFDVSPKLNLTFVFEKKEHQPMDKVSFVFEDVIFNKGKLNFEFDYKSISVLNAKEINKILL